MNRSILYVIIVLTFNITEFIESTNVCTRCSQINTTLTDTTLTDSQVDSCTIRTTTLTDSQALKSTIAVTT